MNRNRILVSFLFVFWTAIAMAAAANQSHLKLAFANALDDLDTDTTGRDTQQDQEQQGFHQQEQLPPPHMQTHPLLQIPCSIQLTETEKQTPIQTFVDTGAQVSVLSVQAAGRAGLLQMMDRRYAGHAQGVGHCRVLGRLPAGAILLHLHGQVVVEAPAVTILEHTPNDGVDLLLGMDFLRDHGAILNLRTEEMLLLSPNGEVSIPFIRPRASMNVGSHDCLTTDEVNDADTEEEEDDEILSGLDMSGL